MPARIYRRRHTLQLLRLMSQNFKIITASGEIMGGTPVFIGTRVPVLSGVCAQLAFECQKCLKFGNL